MDIHDRLGRLRRNRPTPPGHSSNGPTVEELVGGKWIETSEGRYFVAEALYAPEWLHGSNLLGDSLSLAELPLQALASDQGEFDPRRALYMDTETTGLGRSAATLCFMVGLGSWEDDVYSVRQYFCADIEGEEPMLAAIAREVETHEGLVTFNGRSFDWPLLLNRYMLAGMTAPALRGPHVDLLHWARGLWKNRLDSCSLSSLETHVLGIVREGQDTPGYLIPGIYHDYVRSGDATEIAGVFYHNLIDVLSMATLLAQVGRNLCGGEGALCDPYALGRLMQRVGFHDQAIAAFETARTTGEDSHARKAGQELGRLLKRLGRVEDAVRVWKSLLDGSDIEPYVELAKHYEHRERDYAAARQIVEMGMARLAAPTEPTGSDRYSALRRHIAARRHSRVDRIHREQELAELAYRLARINRKLARSQERDE